MSQSVMKFDSNGNLKRRVVANTSSKFVTGMCDEFIEHCKQGKTDVEFYSSKQITRQTFYDWIKRHKVFAVAHELGKAYREAWYLAKGRENLEIVTTKEYSKRLDTNLFRLMAGYIYGMSEHKELLEEIEKLKEIVKSMEAHKVSSAYTKHAEVVEGECETVT